MQRSRSAHHALKGYQYQFDRSIAAILSSADDAPVTLEGIEDIDLPEELIQCKYHETQRYAPSKIRRPIVEFLEHFAATARPPKYTLYAYFSDTPIVLPLSLSDLNSILLKERSGIALTDEDLQRFLDHHLTIQLGDSLEAQQLAVQNLLCSALCCSIDETMLYYYNNALYEVARISRRETTDKRVVTRSAFLRTINQKKILLSIWISQVQSTLESARAIRAELESHFALSPSKEKLLWLSHGLVSCESDDSLAGFCEDLIHKYYRLGYSLKDAKPFTVVFDCERDRMKNIKRALLRRNVAFNDGHAEIEFRPNYFIAEPIINLHETSSGRVTDKVGKSSFELRIADRETFEIYPDAIPQLDTFIAAGSASDAPNAPGGCSRVFHLPDVKDIATLRRILT